MLFVKSGANNLAFEVTLNSVPVLDYTFSGNFITAIHEVVTSARVGRNQLEFRITGGSGTLEFGDVVLHFHQRDKSGDHFREPIVP